MMFEDMELDIKVYIMFNRGMQELEYLQNTLEFLDQSLKLKLDDLEKGFSNDINSLYLNEYESEFLNSYPNKNLPTELILEDLSYQHEEQSLEHESISSYIIQAIVVKQVSIIEKLLKTIYNYSKEDTEEEKPSILCEIKEKGIRKFLCNIICSKREKTFSDINKVATALNKVTNINIKNLNSSYWCQLRVMNELRNRFAHGSDEFIIKQTILKDIKSEFGEDFITIKNSNEDLCHCKIETNFKVLIDFNKNMQDYLKLINTDFNLHLGINTKMPSIGN